ncbi:MAG: hypothetical protein GQ565_06310 [Candidatus Aegiribacteria sp.]|nr:hypothetical protein [Candidatus Aegiribacteria sp.]
MTIRVRDFIYLDMERVRSIVAQLEEGLIESYTKTTGEGTEGTGGVEGGLLGIVKLAGGVKFLLERRETETKTLHDHVYNKVEEALLSQGTVIRIPGDISAPAVADGTYVDSIDETSFVLASGRVAINDFANMRTYLDSFNKMAAFIAYCSGVSGKDDESVQDRNKRTKQLEQGMKLDKKLIDGFKLTFDLFYGERVAIKLTPYDEYPDFRLVGDLNEIFLRDKLSSITYKYGSSPVSEWTILGQVASIPPETPPEIPKATRGSAIPLALEGVFDAYRGLEQMAQSVVYPEIAITPIAIYRG